MNIGIVGLKVGLLGLASITLHEILHWFVAKLTGAKNVRFGMDALGPFVEYEHELWGRLLVNTTPSVVALLFITIAIWKGVFSGLTLGVFYTVTIFVGLFGWSKSDWQPLMEVVTND